MFLSQLKSDKFFQSLFPEIPDQTEFELHKMEFDLQRNILRLTLHTPLLPLVVPKKEVGKEFNYSAIELNYYFVKEFHSDFKEGRPLRLEFNCDIDQKKITIKEDLSSVMSFKYEEVRLGQWNLYQNDV